MVPFNKMQSLAFCVNVLIMIGGVLRISTKEVTQESYIVGFSSQREGGHKHLNGLPVEMNILC